MSLLEGSNPSPSARTRETAAVAHARRRTRAPCSRSSARRPSVRAAVARCGRASRPHGRVRGSRRRRSRCAARRATTSPCTSQSPRHRPAARSSSTSASRPSSATGARCSRLRRRRGGSSGSSSTAVSATSKRWNDSAFPVFSALIALPGATKTLPGEIGGHVTVGGVDVQAGDWVVGDRDGVTVVPGDRARRGARRGPGPRREGDRPVHGAARAARRRSSSSASTPAPSPAPREG